MQKIFRLHYRAQIKPEYTVADMKQALVQCGSRIRQAQHSGSMLTAALYYHDRMLFLYYEAVGEQLETVEPLAGEAGIRESGEDVQANIPYPKTFLAALEPFLESWPGQTDKRLWVHMYHIYYHSIPQDMEEWRRNAVPEMRRGRIAFLREEKLFSYVFYHNALVQEGLLQGDKYQSIGLHENILFSYFEEPKTLTNIKGNGEEASKVIDDWLAVNPESHFIHMPQGGGENFLFLPALLSMGVEDSV